MRCAGEIGDEGNRVADRHLPVTTSRRGCYQRAVVALVSVADTAGGAA
jgi:hypothetical protein